MDSWLSLLLFAFGYTTITVIVVMDEIGRVRNLLYSHSDILPSVLKDDSPGVFPVARCSPRGGCLFEQLRGQNRAFELQNEGWESPRFQPWDDRPTIMVFFVSTNIIVM